MTSTPRPSAVVVLAAGEGTRMRSALPKVLHPLAGRGLLGHVLAAAAALEPERVVVVVGHAREQVSAYLAEVAPSLAPGTVVEPVVQAEQRGTGHAVRVALAAVPDGAAGPVVVLYGDAPLVTPATLRALLDHHARRSAAVTVLTAVLDDPGDLGRVLRGPDGAVLGVVERRDATAEQLAVREINSGMYAFDAAVLRGALGRLRTDNEQGQEYLTDVLGIARADGGAVEAVVADDPTEVFGVNDRAQLAQAAAVLRDRICLRWMRAGVSVLDPASTWIDADAELAPDVALLPQTMLLGPTTVAAGARVGPGTTLRSCEVGEGATVVHTWAEHAVIGPRAAVGPFTYLRAGTVLGEGAKAGAYVETKNAVVGAGAKVPHLSYVGDAEIGEGTNIGAATVFVNYDGVAKHRTRVGAHARIGSDTMLVAPVTVGDGAYTAAGSVVTEDVPPGAMAVARARQRTVEGWTARRRPGTASDRAARAALDAAGGDVETGSEEGS